MTRFIHRESLSEQEVARMQGQNHGGSCAGSFETVFAKAPLNEKTQKVKCIDRVSFVKKLEVQLAD